MQGPEQSFADIYVFQTHVQEALNNLYGPYAQINGLLFKCNKVIVYYVDNCYKEDMATKTICFDPSFISKTTSSITDYISGDTIDVIQRKFEKVS